MVVNTFLLTYSKRMNTNQVIKHFGSKAKAARGLGVCASAISKWLARGAIPIDKQYRIQVLTAGKLKADTRLV